MQIHVDGIGKAYGAVTGLFPITVDVADGEFISVLGPSGCGKSTLLRCLAGLESPTQGRLAFGDRTIFDASSGTNVPPRGRRLGMVFQDLALWPHLSVRENVAFPLQARGEARGAGARALEALSLVRLDGFADRKPHQLSGGQQQRVAFARAIVGHPDLLLMDEPLSALDASLRVDLRTELAALTRALGITTVYVTHDQTEAMSMSDRVLVLRDGHLVQNGTPEQLYERPIDSFTARFVGNFNTLPAESANGRLIGTRPEHVQLRLADAGDVGLGAEVTASSYVGGRYEVRCTTDTGEHWTVYAHANHPAGSRIDLAVPKTAIVDVAV